MATTTSTTSASKTSGSSGSSQSQSAANNSPKNPLANPITDVYHSPYPADYSKNPDLNPTTAGTTKNANGSMKAPPSKDPLKQTDVKINEPTKIGRSSGSGRSSGGSSVNITTAVNTDLSTQQNISPAQYKQLKAEGRISGTANYEQILRGQAQIHDTDISGKKIGVGNYFVSPNAYKRDTSSSSGSSSSPGQTVGVGVSPASPTSAQDNTIVVNQTDKYGNEYRITYNKTTGEMIEFERVKLGEIQKKRNEFIPTLNEKLAKISSGETNKPLSAGDIIPPGGLDVTERSGLEFPSLVLQAESQAKSVALMNEILTGRDKSSQLSDADLYTLASPAVIELKNTTLKREAAEAKQIKIDNAKINTTDANPFNAYVKSAVNFSNNFKNEIKPSVRTAFDVANKAGDVAVTLLPSLSEENRLKTLRENPNSVGIATLEQVNDRRKQAGKSAMTRDEYERELGAKMYLGEIGEAYFLGKAEADAVGFVAGKTVPYITAVGREVAEVFPRATKVLSAAANAKVLSTVTVKQAIGGGAAGAGGLLYGKYVVESENPVREIAFAAGGLSGVVSSPIKLVRVNVNELVADTGEIVTKKQIRGIGFDSGTKSMPLIALDENDKLIVGTPGEAVIRVPVRTVSVRGTGVVESEGELLLGGRPAAGAVPLQNLPPNTALPVSNLEGKYFRAYVDAPLAEKERAFNYDLQIIDLLGKEKGKQVDNVLFNLEELQPKQVPKVSAILDEELQKEGVYYGSAISDIYGKEAADFPLSKEYTLRFSKGFATQVPGDIDFHVTSAIGGKLPVFSKYQGLSKEQIAKGLEFHHTDYLNNKGVVLTKEEHALYHEIESGRKAANTPELRAFMERNKITVSKEKAEKLIGFNPKIDRIMERLEKEAGVVVRRSAKDPAILEFPSSGNKMIEFKFDGALGADETAPEAILGAKMDFSDTVKFGKGRAISAGQQLTRKYSGSSIISVGDATGKEAEAASFSVPGFLGKPARALKDTSGKFQGAIALSTDLQRQPLALDFVRGEKAASLIRKSFATYSDPQKKDIVAKLMSQTGAEIPEKVPLATARMIDEARLSASMRKVSASSPLLRSASKQYGVQKDLLRSTTSRSDSLQSKSVSIGVFSTSLSSSVSQSSSLRSNSMVSRSLTRPTSRVSIASLTSATSPSSKPSASMSTSILSVSPSTSTSVSPRVTSPSTSIGSRSPSIRPSVGIPAESYWFGGSDGGKEEAYNAYVRQGGKAVKVNLKPQTKSAALAAVKFVEDNSSAASGFIKRTTGKAQADEYQYFGSNVKFRQGKRGDIIEKNMFRIDTPGELKGITAKGLLAKRRKMGVFSI